MQKYKLLILLAIGLYVITACGNNSDGNSADTALAEEIKPEFRSQLSDAIENYLELKDALVWAKEEIIHEKANNFKKAVSSISEDNLPNELRARWDKKRSDVMEEIDKFIAREDLMEQRSAFLPLSELVIDCVKEYAPLDKTLYVQHCPMAFDYSGGDWLSATDTIYNPYYGRMMLHCGSVTETFAALQAQ
ncbi:MAG: DUF3347 domain-containing protein [Calditrichae bacterium]|nr:DUF3347 domain-containing protein [Calditrichia bacterium]NIW79937.1 DUF3347 domain-containing protein [Calditrichia bacterium]